MKVGHVTERSDSSTASSFLDNDELERTGIDLGTTGRLQLMARLAEGSLLLHHFCMDSTGLKKKPPFKGSPNKPQSLCHWGTFGHFVPGENDCRYSEEDVICLTNFECLSDRHGKKSALACTPILINTLAIDSNSEQSVDSRAVRNYNSMQPFSFMAGCVRVSLLVGLLVHFDLVPEPDCHCMVNKNGTVISCR